MSTHTHDLSPWQHDHLFDRGNPRGESRTRAVLVVTLITMAAEIVGGWWTGSMALLADGWHMGTHALALGVATLAYAMARRHAHDRRYAFGTWKIEVLGGFASALVLALVAAGIAIESGLRLWRAEPIDAQIALWVAGIGLVVNLVSAWLLHGADDGHGHGHGHGHSHGHSHGHEHRLAPAPGGARRAAHHHHDDHDHRGHHDHAAVHEHIHAPAPQAAAAAPTGTGRDLNLQAAYVHVLADALTSVLAIAALCGALWLGWWWLDPLVGVLGAVVIAVWAVGLLRQTGAVLLDREMDLPLTAVVRGALESDGDARVADLHLWRVGREQFAAVACLVADAPQAPAVYHARLSGLPELVHLSIEVNQCPRAGREPDAESGLGDPLATLPLVRRP